MKVAAVIAGMDFEGMVFAVPEGNGLVQIVLCGQSYVSEHRCAHRGDARDTTSSSTCRGKLVG